MYTRESIIKEAQSFLGTPFRFRGRSKGSGVDCVGLFIGVGVTLGLSWAGDKDDYKVVPGEVTCELLEFLKDNGFKQTEEEKEGNLVLFKYHKARFPCHSAILGVKAETMIHAMNYRDKGGKLHQVREHIFSEPWTKRVHSIWEYPGVVD